MCMGTKFMQLDLGWQLLMSKLGWASMLRFVVKARSRFFCEGVLEWD